MTFILTPKQGEDVQVNGWNWRPTLELIRAEGLLTEENYERMERMQAAARWTRRWQFASQMFSSASWRE